MNMDENFIKEVGIQQWKLNDSFQFKNNKIKVNKHIDFSKKEEKYLYTIPKSFGLDVVEKDSLKIYKFLMKNNILIEPDIDKLMKDPDAKRKIWNENS